MATIVAKKEAMGSLLVDSGYCRGRLVAPDSIGGE